MKKKIVFVFITIFLCISLAVALSIRKNNSEKLRNVKPTLIINSCYNGYDSLADAHIGFCSFIEIDMTVEADENEPAICDDNVISFDTYQHVHFVLKCDDNSFYFVAVNNGENYIVKSTNSGEIVSEIKSEALPTALYSYGDTCAALYRNDMEGTLYSVDFSNKQYRKIADGISLADGYATSIFINDSVIIYKKYDHVGTDKVCIQNGEKVNYFYCKGKCLGFTNDNTVVFLREFISSFYVLYKYNLIDGTIDSRRPIIKRDLRSCAISPDGNYMVAFTATTEPLIDSLYLIDLNHLAEKKYAKWFETEWGCAQWVECW